MSTYIRIRRNGVAAHLHPTLRNPSGRWHSPWERHAGDDAHTVHEAENPIFEMTRRGRQRHYTTEEAIRFGYMSREDLDRYHRALNGEVQIPPRRQTRRRNMLNISGTQHDISEALAGSLVDRPIASEDWLQPISNRRFGIEMECITNITEVIAKARERGLNIQDAGYTHNNTPYWKVVHDGSLSYTGTKAGFHCHEIVSPILRGEAGIRELQVMCTVLAEVGTLVNKTCGLHIHHDAADMTVESARRLVLNYHNAQKAMNKLVALSRRSDNPAHRYCGDYDNAELSRVRTATDIGDMTRDRYRNVNISPAYRAHRTFEFRQHQGTVDFQKITAWLKLGQAMMENAKLGIVIESGTADLGRVLERMGTPRHVNLYFKERLRFLKTATEEELENMLDEEGSPVQRQVPIGILPGGENNSIFTHDAQGRIIPRRLVPEGATVSVRYPTWGTNSDS